jgi:hypothetical protein
MRSDPSNGVAMVESNKQTNKSDIVDDKLLLLVFIDIIILEHAHLVESSVDALYNSSLYLAC